ncbi:hypothetical protein ES703_84861 [subsurface metagenome]
MHANKSSRTGEIRYIIDAAVARSRTIDFCPVYLILRNFDLITPTECSLPIQNNTFNIMALPKVDIYPLIIRPGTAPTSCRIAIHSQVRVSHVGIWFTRRCKSRTVESPVYLIRIQHAYGDCTGVGYFTRRNQSKGAVCRKDHFYCIICSRRDTIKHD